MVIYAMHPFIYAPAPVKPSYLFVLAKESLNNCADGINMVTNYKN